MVIHTESDRISHMLWEKKKYIDQLYVKMDQLVGEYQERYDDHEIIIVSDHGFGSCYSVVYVNNFLQKWGLLNFKNTEEKRVNKEYCIEII